NADSVMYIMFKDTTYRFTFDSDPAQDGSVFFLNSRGCVNQRTWAKISGTVFIMDKLGIYALADGGVQDIGTPIRDVFNRLAPGDYKIDWTYSDYFHVIADMENTVVRFFVSLNGPGLPRHALCFNYLKNQWWLEEFSFPITSSTLWRTD